MITGRPTLGSVPVTLSDARGRSAVRHAGAADASGTADTSVMRVSEFWARLEQQLGRTFAESWASDFAIGALGGRTARQALADGDDPKQVWRAVHHALELPDSQR